MSVSTKIRNTGDLGDDVVVILVDGSKVHIPPGKSGSFIVRRDNKFHLLNCKCELCVEARAKAAKP